MNVWALWLSCETPAAPPDRAAEARTRQPENSKRAHLSAPALQTPPKFNEKTPPEREEKNEFCGGREQKKRDGPPTFRPPTLRAPTLRAPTFSGFGPPPQRPPTPSGPFWPPHTFGAPTFWAPTLSAPPVGPPPFRALTKTKNWPNAVWPNSANKNWPNLAK